MTELLHNYCNISECPHSPHELVLAIWRDEADAALRVELAEAHTLVKGAVVDGYGLLATAGEHREPEGVSGKLT